MKDLSNVPQFDISSNQSFSLHTSDSTSCLQPERAKTFWEITTIKLCLSIAKFEIQNFWEDDLLA